MRSIKQLSNEELGKLVQEIDGAIKDYEKFFDKEKEYDYDEQLH